MNNKLEKVLLIKYIRDCIRQHEIDLVTKESYRTYMHSLELCMDEFKSKFEYNKQQVLSLFPHDATVEQLIESELKYLNDFDLKNQQDKDIVQDYLQSIDLNRSLEDIKNDLHLFLFDLKQNATYHYQLSDVLHGCLAHE